MTVPALQEVKRLFKESLRARMLSPAALLRCNAGLRRASAWLAQIRPPPPMPAESLDMLRGLTKAVASLRMSGVVAEGSEGGAEHGGSEAHIRELFSQLDTDGSGFLEREEVAALSEQLGLQIGEEQLDAAIKLMDEDGDGVVDFPVRVQRSSCLSGCTPPLCGGGLGGYGHRRGAPLPCATAGVTERRRADHRCAHGCTHGLCRSL